MTHIDNLIDAIIAINIMGWSRGTDGDGWVMQFGNARGFRFDEDWCPTGRIEDAYAMEEKLKETPEVWEKYGAFFMELMEKNVMLTSDVMHASPKKRCIAALKALNITIPEVTP